jgi:tRNA-specific 2-thiouridylase
MNRFSADKTNAETRVVVAMSGGVDSSVVAALMHEEGYEVIGITLQLYDHGQAVGKKNACCAGQDIEDARNVCEKIGIPHYVLNYESIFKQSVIDDFADSYMRGETPIPCVKCNQSVKFRDLFTVAKDLGADALVTGHYIRRLSGENGPELHNAIDAGKDQSYFLFQTTKKQLEFIHFPLGDMTKEETRKHAERFNLPVSSKPDSQDICFVPNGNYASVVSKIRPGAIDPGDIIDIKGNVLGRHNGIINFTRGQRKGLGGGFEKPLYVIKVDADKKQVVVGEEEHLYSDELTIKDFNWLGNGNNIPLDGIEADVRLRSLSGRKAAKIYPLDKGLLKVKLYEPERAITPGQACVIYDDTRVLGGGWIV